jgi:hypothetical protein
VARQDWTGHWLFPRRIVVTSGGQRNVVEYTFYRRTGQKALFLDVTHVRDRVTGVRRAFHHGRAGVPEHILHLHAEPLVRPTNEAPGRVLLRVAHQRRDARGKLGPLTTAR